MIQVAERDGHGGEFDTGLQAEPACGEPVGGWHYCDETLPKKTS